MQDLNRWSINGLSVRLDADAGLIETAIICCGFASLSLLFTGAVFGIDNHTFHLPIVHELYGEKQFQNNSFIQSLRYYSSGLWLMLSGVGKYVDDRLLFLILLFLSRLLSFVGLVCCGSVVGIRSVKHRFVFCSILCFTSILQGTSFSGHGALFVNSFGHTEVANGTILLALYFAARGRVELSIIFGSATFFISAFAGVWVAIPIAGVFALLSLRGEISFGQLLFRSSVGALSGILIASPVLVNVVANPDFFEPISFSYSDYLRFYFGEHFFLESNSVLEVGLLLIVAGLGWFSLSSLGRDAIAFKAALLGMMAVYLIGCVLPFVPGGSRILNLHLLRSGVMIHLVAAMAAVALATKWLCDGDDEEKSVFGPYLLFCLWVKFLFPAALVLVTFTKPLREWVSAGHDRKIRTTILASLIVVVLPWVTWRQAVGNMDLTAAASEWRMVGDWARSSTAFDSVFLIAVVKADAGQIQEDRRGELLVAASAAFETISRRQSWVDYKRGAAVMWRPSYFEEWMTRFRAVSSLTSVADVVEYSRNNRIGYVIIDCHDLRETGLNAVFRTERLCVFAPEPKAKA